MNLQRGLQEKSITIWWGKKKSNQNKPNQTKPNQTNK
jgi:hypothetical protein